MGQPGEAVRSGESMPGTIWTLGHSTRSLEEFMALLARHQIEAVADVRSFPGSKRHPQYGKSALGAALAGHGIEYRWLPKLGGRRRPLPDSPNIAWRNASFRGYADHMASAEFAEGLQDLLEFSASRRTALMCAEAVWWRCHRALISDALCAGGIEVIHILDAEHAVTHPLTAPARIEGGRLSYVADPEASAKPKTKSKSISH